MGSCPTCARRLYSNGASEELRDGVVTTYRAPQVRGESGAMKDAATVRREAEWWARHRLGRKLNTVGPDGREGEWEFRALGALPGTQQFGAMHDVQTAEARRQAELAASRDPKHREEISAAFEAAKQESGWRGYALTVTAARRGDPLVAATRGAAASQEVYRSRGFEVPSPGEISPALRDAALSEE